jgi:predicted nuclease of predicted toxin-antitoxin system
MKETGINDNVTYYSILSKPIGSLNITLSGNMNYKGEKITPNVTIKDNDVILTKDKDYTVSYGVNVSKNGTITINSKNVYNESSKIFYTSNVTKSFNIEPIDDVITVEAKTASYTGSKITANTAKTISNSKITYTYFDSTNCTGNQLGDAPINKGNYSVKIVSAGNDNYNPAETCVPHTITQGKPTVTLKNKEANYSGSQIQIDAPTIKNPNGSIISIPYTKKYYNNSNCSGSAISVPINGGTYSAKVITNENNNLLSADSNCATLKINSIENPTVVTPVANIKYGDNKKMVVTTKLQGTIYYSVGTELTKDNYTSGKTSIPTSKDLSKNDYNVYYYVKGNNNYKDTKGFVIVSVGIIQNTIEVSPVTGISYGENKGMVTTKNEQGVVYYSVGTELTDDNYTSGSIIIFC